MKCSKCGFENEEGTAFCVNCGAAVSAEQPATETAQPEQQATHAQPQYNPQPQAQYQSQFYSPYAPQMTPDMLPDNLKPIGAWAYFGYSILFSLPIVGFILLIVFSVSSGTNINLRNFARSHFCALIIFGILAIIALVIIIVMGVSLGDIFSYKNSHYYYYG